MCSFSTRIFYLRADNLGVLQNGDDVTHRGNAHIVQVFLVQIKQHGPLYSVVCERDSVVRSLTWNDQRKFSIPCTSHSVNAWKIFHLKNKPAGIPASVKNLIQNDVVSPWVAIVSGCRENPNNCKTKQHGRSLRIGSRGSYWKQIPCVVPSPPPTTVNLFVSFPLWSNPMVFGNVSVHGFPSLHFHTTIPDCFFHAVPNVFEGCWNWSQFWVSEYARVDSKDLKLDLDLNLPFKSFWNWTNKLIQMCTLIKRHIPAFLCPNLRQMPTK